ncbi:MAG: DUF5106 domain-containing protein [Rikenellaceae bacterium]
MKKVIILFSCVLFFVACGGANKKVVKSEEKKFVYVKAPTMMGDKKEAVAYLVTHFWDNFDFTDTAYISLPEVLEQAISNYVDMLPMVDSAVSAKSIDSMVVKSEVDTAMFNYLTDKLLDYVGNPNSPLRNELSHINVLKAMLANPMVDSTEKIAYVYKLKMVSKNRVGQKAADFRYFTRDGVKGKMSSIKSEYTLIFFNHLGCNACAGVKTTFEGDDMLADLIKTKRLTMLCIFPDADKSDWLKADNKFASMWINGADTDSDIDLKELYYLPAIPSLYLLDKTKTVILKDADASQILSYLAQNFNRQ